MLSKIDTNFFFGMDFLGTLFLLTCIEFLLRLLIAIVFINQNTILDYSPNIDMTVSGNIVLDGCKLETQAAYWEVSFSVLLTQ